MAKITEQIVLEIGLEASEAIQELRELNDELFNAQNLINKTGKAVDKNNDHYTVYHKKINDAKKGTDGFGKSLKKAKQLVIALGLLKVGAQASKLAMEFDSINNSLLTVTDSQEQANAEFQFASDLANDLGQNLQTISKGYIKLLGATKGTALAGKVTQDLATGVTEMATAMGLADSEAKGIISAVSQIATKGKLSTEELLQLAERGVPSFKLASDAIGVTTGELTKMLEQGEIMSDEFLPKFADQLRETFAEDALRGAQSSQAQLNRLKNEWNELLVKVGGGINKFIPHVANLVGWVNQTTDAISETVDGMSIWLDELYGITDATGDAITQEELLALKAKKAEQEIQKQALAMAESEKQAKKMAEGLKKAISELSEFQSLLLNQDTEEAFKELTEELGLSDKGAKAIKGAFMELRKEGQSLNAILARTQGFLELQDDSFFRIADEQLRGMAISAESRGFIAEVGTPRPQEIFDEVNRSLLEVRENLDLRKELGLTQDQFKVFADTIQDGIEKGLSVDDIREQINRAKRAFGEQLPQDPFAKLTKSFQKLKDNISLRKELGLNVKEFGHFKEAIQESIDQGLSLEEIREKIQAIKDSGLVPKEESGPKPIETTAIESGTVEARQTLLEISNRAKSIDDKILEENEKQTGVLEEIRDTGGTINVKSAS